VEEIYGSYSEVLQNSANHGIARRRILSVVEEWSIHRNEERMGEVTDWPPSQLSHDTLDSYRLYKERCSTRYKRRD
jgi:hypothetical protein